MADQSVRTTLPLALGAPGLLARAQGNRQTMPWRGLSPSYLTFPFFSARSNLSPLPPQVEGPNAVGQRLSDAAFAGDVARLEALLAEPSVNVDAPDNVRSRREALRRAPLRRPAPGAAEARSRLLRGRPAAQRPPPRPSTRAPSRPPSSSSSLSLTSRQRRPPSASRAACAISLPPPHPLPRMASRRCTARA